MKTKHTTFKLGTYKGRAIYQWRGVVEMEQCRPIEIAVVSAEPAEAAELLYQEAMRACAPRLVPFEITVYGVRGGRAARRYAGYETLIAHELLFSRRRDNDRNQLTLALPKEGRSEIPSNNQAVREWGVFRDIEELIDSIRDAAADVAKAAKQQGGAQ